MQDPTTPQPDPAASPAPVDPAAASGNRPTASAPDTRWWWVALAYRVHRKAIPVAPYLGVLAAGLAFGAWLANTFLVESAKAQKEVLNEIKNSKLTHEYLKAIEDEQRNLEARLTRIEERLGFPPDVHVSTDAQREFISATNDLDAISAWGASLSELSRLSDHVLEISTAVDLSPDDASELAKARSSVEDLVEQYSKIQKEAGAIVPGATQSSTVSLNQITEAISATVRHESSRVLSQAREVVARSVAVENRLLHVESRIYSQADERRATYTTYAGILRAVVVILTVLGTTLALYGKFCEVHYKENARHGHGSEGPEIEVELE